MGALDSGRMVRSNAITTEFEKGNEMTEVTAKLETPYSKTADTATGVLLSVGAYGDATRATVKLTMQEAVHLFAELGEQLTEFRTATNKRISDALALGIKATEAAFEQAH